MGITAYVCVRVCKKLQIYKYVVYVGGAGVAFLFKKALDFSEKYKYVFFSIMVSRILIARAAACQRFVLFRI